MKSLLNFFRLISGSYAGRVNPLSQNRFIPIILLTVAVMGLSPPSAATTCGGQAKIMVNSPVIFTFTPSAGTTSTEIPFQLAAITESRLQVQLRVPLAGARVALIAPENRLVVTPDDSKTIIQAGDETQHPELGDFFILPEQRDPTPGSWILRLIHPPAAGSERITVAVTLLERFQLNMVSSGKSFNAGEEVILTILATDYGKPILRLSPSIEVRADDKSLIARLSASENQRAPSGILLSNEPGLYIARYVLPYSGVFEFSTQLGFPGRTGNLVKTADVVVEVGSSLISLNPLSAKMIRTPAGCVERIEFIIGLTAQESGTYTVSLFLQGKENTEIELSATQEYSSGLIWYRIPLYATETRLQLNQEWATFIKRLDVLHFDEQKITLVHRSEEIQVLPAVAVRDLCHPVGDNY